MFSSLIDGDLGYNEAIGWILIAILPLIYLVCWPLLWLPYFIYLSYFIYKQFLSIEWINPDGKSVYITGCGHGFGLELALALEERGFTVFAGCRNPSSATELQSRAAQSARIKILDLDVTDEKQVAKCAQVIEATCKDNGLWSLCNNAGYSTAGEIEWVQMEEYQRVFDINLWGTIRVTKSVLPLIRKAKGRIITVSSGIARAVNPGRSAYSMSKTAQEAFTDCLRYEMHKFGVKCSTIVPGNLTGATNIFTGMADKIDKIYEKLDHQTKEAYGVEYLSAFRHGIVGYKTNCTQLSMVPVVDSIIHAIASKEPRVRYKPAQASWLVWWLFYHTFPEELTDYYITHWYLRRLPKPTSMK